MRTGSCFRELVEDSCQMRMEETNFSKRNCCCSSFGKAWGSPCEICPLKNSGMFLLFEICHYFGDVKYVGYKVIDIFYLNQVHK